MKNLKFLLYLLTALLLPGLTACSDDDDSPVGFVDGNFKVSKTELNLAGTTPQSITILSDDQPSVTADAAWVNIGQVERTASGKMYTCRISGAENADFNPRTATVTVTAGANKATIAVTQFGAETVQLKSVTPSQALEPMGGSVTISYAATDEVDVTAPEWLTKVESRTLTDGSVTFSYSGNFDADRTGDVVIALKKDTSKSITVTLTQAKAESSGNMNSSARELIKKIHAGVNIGNTMECPGAEGSWGTGEVKREYIQGLKQMGFNAVRIPCAWDSHVSDAANNTIDPAWLSRVEEVIGWCVAEDMYVVLNIHWDGGWLEESVSSGYDEAVNKKQHDYWTQIAAKLNHFDEHLMFAGMNEPGMQNGVADKCVDAIVKYQQTFTDAVRATGGNNALRCLIHQAPSTDIDNLTKYAQYKLPNDAATDRAIVEVHMYDPSDFTIMSNDGDWAPTVKYYWGSQFHVDGSDRNCTWGEESHIDARFNTLKNYIEKLGVPAIVGEYACQNLSSSAPGIDFDRWKQSRAYWTEYITRTAKNAGAATFYWETGGDISRTSGSAKNQYVIDALMQGAADGRYPF